MTNLPSPVWPVVLLAVISVVDAIMCLKPADFIAQNFRDVGWPQKYWPLMPPLKLAAAAGLIAGIWVPVLGVVTSACLVLYFLVAIAMHVRAHDYGRNLFLNATGMLVICTAVLVVSFLV